MRGERRREEEWIFTDAWFFAATAIVTRASRQPTSARRSWLLWSREWDGMGRDGMDLNGIEVNGMEFNGWLIQGSNKHGDKERERKRVEKVKNRETE